VLAGSDPPPRGAPDDRSKRLARGLLLAAQRLSVQGVILSISGKDAVYLM